MAQNNFSDQLWNGLGGGVADIREKFEEAVWGRAVTEPREAMQWPEAMEPEPQPGGLSGEVLGPELEPMTIPDSVGLLEHGFVLDQQPMNESPAHWPGAQEQQAIEHQPEQDMDLDR